MENERAEREKMIVFSSREICYNSGSFFANQIADAFETLGFDVTVCEFTCEDDLDAVLTPFYGKKYRLLLDFNSAMTRMAEADGTPVLDFMDGPFLDYVLDHPLFHYNCLRADLKNLNAVFVDETHESYARRYYPNLKKTVTMPLGAAEAVADWRKKEEKAVLFMGTYDSPDSVYELIKAAPEPLGTYMKKLIDMRTAEPNLPMEEAFRSLLTEEGEEISDERFALLMNAMYPVDVFIRDYFRKEAVDALVRKKIPVRLAGEGWHKYDGCQNVNVRTERQVTFGVSFEKIAHADILLNVSPFFNHGAHDRIFAAMANHCVSLTDENPYLKRLFTDRKEVCMYSLKNLSTLTECAGELLENDRLLDTVKEHAYRQFKDKYTWRKKAEQLLACTFPCNQVE